MGFMIRPSDLGDNEQLAREVLVLGRSIAPRITTFADGSEEQQDAIAILKRVYDECIARGPRFVKGQSIGPGRIEYREVSSAFDADSRSALRSIGAAAAGGGLSVGSFPTERPLQKLWPETYE